MPQLAAYARELQTLAVMLDRMPLASHKAPEAPHEARSELVRAMSSLSRRIAAGADLEALDPEPASKRRKVSQAVVNYGIRGVVAADGRIVPVVKR